MTPEEIIPNTSATITSNPAMDSSDCRTLIDLSGKLLVAPESPVRSEKEIRDLLFRTYESLAGMGPFPPELDALFLEFAANPQLGANEKYYSDNHSLRAGIARKAAVRILRWVLKDIEPEVQND